MERKATYYKAEEGKQFVLTEKGKAECASYQYKVVGEPVDEYPYEASIHSVEKGYVVEAPIPNWVETEGFKVVYYSRGYEIGAGNGTVFPARELAEKYLATYQKNFWVHEELYIVHDVFKGIRLSQCRIHEGKPVYDKTWYYGTDALAVGDLVEEEIVEDLMDILPPACMREDCCQIGEAADHELDEAGRAKPTYVTFKKVAENTWEYCGECFRGQNVATGKPIIHA